jgi:hypothetical protein
MINLPVLSSLTELLTGTVTDEFKKVIQPASLVAAAIFMALNLVLIFPPLVPHRVAPVVALEALPSAWQIVLGTLTLAAMGYVINSLGGFFLGLLSGDAFRDSLVGETLRTRQRSVFTRLETKAKDTSPDDNERSRAAHRLANEFPREKEALAPTRLGNILLSAASYTWHQYRAHLDTLWPVMDLALEGEDKELRKRLSESQDALKFLASLTVLLVVVAVELVIVGVFLQQPLHAVLGAPLTLLVAYLVYRAAVQKSRTWGRDMKAAFDLHLDAVAKKLGLRELPKQKLGDRRTRWERVSRWLAYGATFDEDPQKESWYEPVAPQPPKFEVEYPPTIDVVKECVPRPGRMTTLYPTRRPRQCLFGEVADYVFSVTNTRSGWQARRAAGAYLLVTDSRLSVEQAVRGKLFVANPSASKQKASTQNISAEWHSGKPPALLWRLGDVPPWTTLVLQYTVRYSDEVIVEVAPKDFSIVGLKAVLTFKESEIIEVVVQNHGNPSPVTITATLPHDNELPSRKATFFIGNAPEHVSGKLHLTPRIEASWTSLSQVPKGKCTFLFTRHLK